MATRLQPSQIQNLQTLEAVVNSSEGPLRLITVTGQTLSVGFGANSQGPFIQSNQTLTLLVGPTLTRQQFVRAICTASIAQTSHRVQIAPGDFSCGIVSSDADWDDESGQVELRVELTLSLSGSGNSVQINSFSFQVTILAAAG